MQVSGSQEALLTQAGAEGVWVDVGTGQERGK